ncbi:Uncharacterized protein FKW44_006301, partial [Caligus rogercresseyi]
PSFSLEPLILVRNHSMVFLRIVASLFIPFSSVSAIFCYKCEGTRDFRCSDPMDPRPFPLYDCDSEPWARDKKP